jgi:uncharacterized RDD family membrane protein YckC
MTTPTPPTTAPTTRRRRPGGPGRRGTTAGFATRAAAYVIDAMVIVGLLSVLTFAVTAVVTLITAQDSPLELPTGWITTILTISAVGITYLTLGWWLFGRTVGKLVLGVRVVDANGRRPSLVQAFVRAVLYTLSAAFFIGFAWVAITPRRRAWHDLIARTWVVYDWAAHPRTYYDDDPLPPVRP